MPGLSKTIGAPILGAPGLNCQCGETALQASFCNQRHDTVEYLLDAKLGGIDDHGIVGGL